MRQTHRWFMLALILVATLMLAACGDDKDADVASSSTPSPAASAAAPAPSYGEVLVFAASSLTEAFKEAGKAFEAAHPGTTVTFNFAASSALATQINEGAPADVFASADVAQMEAVTKAGNASRPQNFATNVPVVVMPAGGSPVKQFADLAAPGVKLVLAGPEVPIGRYARQAIGNAGKGGTLGADFEARVLANVRSEEANVRAVLAKVQLGEADAGIVYSTDLAAAGKDVTTTPIPAQWNVLATYPVAVTNGGKAPAGGEAFTAFLLGQEGQSILAKHGFGKPLPQ